MYLRGIPAKFALVACSVAVAGFGFHATQASPSLPTVNTEGGGYRTSDLGYSLRASDKRLIDEIHFKITPASATAVRAQVVKDGPWYDCSVHAGEVSCDTSSDPAEASRASELSVIVSE